MVPNGGQKSDPFLEEIKKDFVNEISALLEQCEGSFLKLENPKDRVQELATIFRVAHSIKGSGSALGYEDFSNFAHLLEDCLSLLQKQPELIDHPNIPSPGVISLLLEANDALKAKIAAIRDEDPSPWNVQKVSDRLREMNLKLQGLSTSSSSAGSQTSTASEPESVQSVIQIDAGRLDTILNIVGELVVIKSQLINQAELHPTDMKLNETVATIDKTIRDLQERTLILRMTPLKNTFIKLQRALRDLSTKLGKPIVFEVSGEETEIDRNMVELLSDPLLHICRNALDHGIESQEVRKQKGKPEKGSIRISSKQFKGRVVIEITDDGAGLNLEKIVNKAKEQGLLAPQSTVQSMPVHAITDLIFQPGFSTSDSVTSVSGRGVGMDVVRNNIEKLRGKVNLNTQEGLGTTISISLPVTTSIADAMLIRVGRSHYVIPVVNIRALVEENRSEKKELDKVISHEEQLIPILDLKGLLGSSDVSPGETKSDSEKNTLIVVEAGEKVVALRPDQVYGQQQVVLKSLGASFDTSNGISGATILGDGQVALVLDPVGLSEYAESAPI